MASVLCFVASGVQCYRSSKYSKSAALSRKEVFEGKAPVVLVEPGVIREEDAPLLDRLMELYCALELLNCCSRVPSGICYRSHLSKHAGEKEDEMLAGIPSTP